jgi:16S rRNA (guanine966-N2)-methyltransferase
MKDRTREAVFNLLGHTVEGAHAVDLFAGTGALGLEALSRGAVSATFLERHVPTAKVLRENAAQLGVEDRCTILSADAFAWASRHTLPGDVPWVVFCSPPYDFYVDRREAMLSLIGGLFDAAPAGSAMVIEADERFDIGLLPAADWDVRRYSPAVIALAWKASASSP